MEWIEVVLEEYKTLRQESLTAMQTQQSTLSFGIAALGFMVGAGFNTWGNDLVAEFVFLVFIPLLSYLVLIIWMGEVARMMRAGIFLVDLEKKINEHYQARQPALTWENWLRDSNKKDIRDSNKKDMRDSNKKDNKKPQLLWNYKSIIMLFFLISIFSVISVNIKMYSCYGLRLTLLIDMAEAIIFFAVFFFVYRQGKSFK